MDTTTTKQEEVLVLIDQQGIYYTIPRQVLEQYRATDDQKVEIEATREGDVTGYGNFGALDLYVHEQTISGILAERREQVEQERLANEARSAASTQPAATVEREPCFINIIAAFTTRLTSPGFSRSVK